MNTKEVVENLIDDQQSIQISVIKDATHGMLDAEHFNEQSPGLVFLLKPMWKGERAVAPEFYIKLDEWLSSRISDSMVTLTSENNIVFRVFLANNRDRFI